MSGSDDEYNCDLRYGCYDSFHPSKTQQAVNWIAQAIFGVSGLALLGTGGLAVSHFLLGTPLLIGALNPVGGIILLTVIAAAAVISYTTHALTSEKGTV